MKKILHSRLLVPSLALLLLCGCLTSHPLPQETRPAQWAQPVSGASLRNFWRVTPGLYRSSYPENEQDADALRALGIATVINLRAHTDSEAEIRHGGFVVHRYKMKAGSVSSDDLRNVLRLMLNSPQPVLVHCWHGADRTGFIIAGYRIVCQGWDKEEAIREMRLGGFGFHDTYANIAPTLRALDVPALRHELGLE